MIHSPALLDALSALPTEKFNGVVFRATPQSLNPLAPSTRGGRWAPPDEFPVLNTSLAAGGARAELAFHWTLLNPLPSRLAIVHNIKLSATKTIRLNRGQLAELGVDPAGYSGLRYAATQRIGAAVRHIGHDAIIVPSPRWDCDNLVLLSDNHASSERLGVIESTQFNWLEWAIEHNLVDREDSEVQTALAFMRSQ